MYILIGKTRNCERTLLKVYDMYMGIIVIFYF